MKKLNLSKAYLKKELWKIFSQYIRLRDKGCCFTCGKKREWKMMHAGHYIPKSICGEILYFSEKNVNCQCAGCNTFKHGNLIYYALQLRQKYGDNILEELQEIKKEGKILSSLDFLKMIKEYTIKVDELKASYF